MSPTTCGTASQLKIILQEWSETFCRKLLVSVSTWAASRFRVVMGTQKATVQQVSCRCKLDQAVTLWESWPLMDRCAM